MTSSIGDHHLPISECLCYYYKYIKWQGAAGKTNYRGYHGYAFYSQKALVLYTSELATATGFSALIPVSFWIVYFPPKQSQPLHLVTTSLAHFPD